MVLKYLGKRTNNTIGSDSLIRLTMEKKYCSILWYSTNDNKDTIYTTRLIRYKTHYLGLTTYFDIWGRSINGYLPNYSLSIHVLDTLLILHKVYRK